MQRTKPWWEMGHQHRVGTSAQDPSWGTMGVISSMEQHPVPPVGFHAMQGVRSKAGPTNREFSAWKVAGGSLAPHMATVKLDTAVKNVKFLPFYISELQKVSDQPHHTNRSLFGKTTQFCC